jgi:hypothetical protein
MLKIQQLQMHGGQVLLHPWIEPHALALSSPEKGGHQRAQIQFYLAWNFCQVHGEILTSPGAVDKVRKLASL